MKKGGSEGGMESKVHMNVQPYCPVEFHFKACLIISLHGNQVLLVAQRHCLLCMYTYSLLLSLIPRPDMQLGSGGETKHCPTEFLGRQSVIHDCIYMSVLHRLSLTNTLLIYTSYRTIP